MKSPFKIRSRKVQVLSINLTKKPSWEGQNSVKMLKKKVRRFIVKCTVVAKYFTTHKVQSVFNVPRFMVG